MAKATSIEAREEAVQSAQRVNPDEARAALNDVVLLTLPTKFFVQISNEAARRNMTPSELLRRAVLDYLERTDPDKKATVRLLQEEK